MIRASLVTTALRVLRLVFALIAISFLFLALTPIALTQAPPEFKYDLKAEQTFKGTVLEVKKIPKAISGHDAINLVVKTEKGNVEVEVGPAAFLDDMGVSFKTGDEVKIVASKCKRDSDVVAAREITQGENDTITVRDPKGEPVWTWMMKKG
jgi:hypothetical protein